MRALLSPQAGLRLLPPINSARDMGDIRSWMMKDHAASAPFVPGALSHRRDARLPCHCHRHMLGGHVALRSADAAGPAPPGPHLGRCALRLHVHEAIPVPERPSCQSDTSVISATPDRTGHSPSWFLPTFQPHGAMRCSKMVLS